MRGGRPPDGCLVCRRQRSLPRDLHGGSVGPALAMGTGRFEREDEAMDINSDAPVITRDEILISAPIQTIWDIQTDVAE